MMPPTTEWKHFHVPVTEARTMGLDKFIVLFFGSDCESEGSL
jgi:hypothetical protein